MDFGGRDRARTCDLTDVNRVAVRASVAHTDPARREPCGLEFANRVVYGWGADCMVASPNPPRANLM